jgi:hypothetical protein
VDSRPLCPFRPRRCAKRRSTRRSLSNSYTKQIQELNRVLQEARDGVGEFEFWLADAWPNAPRDGEDATKPPIAQDWRSPFRGKSIQDVVAFMKKLPEDRYIDYHYFAVLGDDFTNRGVVTIYRVGDEYLVGDELGALPCTVTGRCLCCGFGREAWANVL